MLIAIEGVSAAGKTTWASRYKPAVVEELTGTAPETDIEQIAEFWSKRDSERWQRGVTLEAEHSIACFDTDPLKIHYAWCLWQNGQGNRDQWTTRVRATRRRIVQRQIGFVDQIIFLDPTKAVVREQKKNDLSRHRRNFENHIQLQEPLRRWYQLLEQLAPGRVIFNAHELKCLPVVETRPDRYSIELFDAFINAADQRPIDI